MITLLKFLEKQFVLRNENDHKEHCRLVEADKSGAQSKEFGINRDSVLNELEYFHVCNGGLLPDIMHDVLEGALQYEVKLMLHWMIESACYFTLDDLNSRLENLELGHMESKSHPSLISGKTMMSEGNSLKQNGLYV